MKIKEKVLADLKTAMKEKKETELLAIRAVKSAIDKFDKENPGVHENYNKALKPLIKQRLDSRDQFKIAGKLDLALNESREIDVINNYVVEMELLSEVEIREIITNNFKAIGQNSIGPIMSYFKTNHDGKYDAKMLSQIAKQFTTL